jgi:starch phosphorylase/maltose phosphorylase
MTTRDKLQSIAINLWWSWSPEARSLFRRLNPEVFRTSGNNPQAAPHPSPG